MKLERVDIFGFKSFGEKVEVTFHEGMTAIVGPNGCGKSNISDAIGWVLGEQSAKSLRGQKMEDVIFNGSQSRPPLSLAEVNLRVSRVELPGVGDDDGDGKKSARARKGEVVVTRRLDRNGNSEYLIDGVASRLRDVHELFMGTGVGAKAYAIIEQGKIGLILSSKPTDRRFLIEEAAGITKYKSRRRSAELKLSAAQQNLLRVNDIVYEITRQMNSLKRQAGKARRYNRLRDKMTRLERIVSVKKSRELDQRLSETRRRLQGIADEELRRSVSLTTGETFLERSRLLQAAREGELDDTREALHRLELLVERLDQSIDRDKRQLVELDERRGQIETEQEELLARRGPLTERLEERRREEAKLREELDGREAETALHERRLKEASLSLAEIESTIEERRGEILHRVSKIAAFNNFLQGVLANSEKVSAELLKLEAEAKEVDGEERKLVESRQALATEIEEHGRRATALGEERTDLEAGVSAVRAALEALEAEIASEKESLSASSARLASLEDLVQARAHFGSGARLILTKGPELGIRVLGSVADAVEVEERLERAAEAFFDLALQRVRVGDEEDVARARELLRSEPDAGRSELLVESLSTSTRAELPPRLEELRSRGTPGVVGLLSEGIRFSVEGLRESIPDAIVVETYDDALRCFKLVAAPYVSLDGDVLLPPGVAVLGPGGASEGLLATRREIRELEEKVAASRERLGAHGQRRRASYEDLEAKESRLEKIREQQHVLEKTLVGLEHRRSQLEEENGRIERKRSILASEQSRASSERLGLSKKREEMEASLADEERAKGAAEAALETLRAKLSSRRTNVDELQANAVEERTRLAALKERCDGVRVDVERLSEGVSELEARITAYGNERSNLVERKARLGEGIERATVEMERAVASRSETIEVGRALEAKLVIDKKRVETTESALKLRRQELTDVRESRSNAEVVLATEESDRRHLQQSFVGSFGMTIEEAATLLQPADLLLEDEAAASELAELKRKLDAIGPVNPMADEEFKELETRHEFVTKQRQDLIDSIESTESAIGRIDRTSRQRFREAFDAINESFGETFRQLFGGGGAGLRLVDETDLLESGIDIIAQPPGKKLQNVLLLSGGEKAMTAIALLFAIFRYRPSPFCLLDEVDAPLDETNVGRFLTMLRELRDTTQFIVITHNRKTMEMADRLYGVTMEEPGISKLVSVNFAEEPEAALART